MTLCTDEDGEEVIAYSKEYGLLSPQTKATFEEIVRRWNRLPAEEAKPREWEEEISRVSQEIMNLPCAKEEVAKHLHSAYAIGHRDARHAAAELVLGLNAASPSREWEEVAEAWKAYKSEPYSGHWSALTKALDGLLRLRLPRGEGGETSQQVGGVLPTGLAPCFLRRRK